MRDRASPLPGLGQAETPVVQVASPAAPGEAPQAGRLVDFQRFHRELDSDKGFSTDPGFNFHAAAEEVGRAGAGVPAAPSGEGYGAGGRGASGWCARS